MGPEAIAPGALGGDFAASGPLPSWQAANSAVAATATIKCRIAKCRIAKRAMPLLLCAYFRAVPPFGGLPLPSSRLRLVSQYDTVCCRNREGCALAAGRKWAENLLFWRIICGRRGIICEMIVSI
jgi:hypothetical protein